jgi:hypothetical protein
VVFGMVLRGQFVMFHRMELVPMRHVRVMGRRVVIAGDVRLVRFAMVMGGSLQMRGGFLVVIVFAHVDLLCWLFCRGRRFDSDRDPHDRSRFAQPGNQAPGHPAQLIEGVDVRRVTAW